MRGLPRPTPPAFARLKEADAFQRLVYAPPPSPFPLPYRLKEADAFQRLVLDSAGGGRDREVGLKEADAFQRLVLDRKRTNVYALYGASKKQTPFSVWYAAFTRSAMSSPESPQRSRRLSASGIWRTRRSPSARTSPQRSRRLSASGMSSSPVSPGCRSNTPQRSRRLSASGIHGRRREGEPNPRASKKQTPFSVWYWYAIRPQV